MWGKPRTKMLQLWTLNHVRLIQLQCEEKVSKWMQEVFIFSVRRWASDNVRRIHETKERKCVGSIICSISQNIHKITIFHIDKFMRRKWHWIPINKFERDLRCLIFHIKNDEINPNHDWKVLKFNSKPKKVRSTPIIRNKIPRCAIEMSGAQFSPSSTKLWALVQVIKQEFTESTRYFRVNGSLPKHDIYSITYKIWLIFTPTIILERERNQNFLQLLK